MRKPMLYRAFCRISLIFVLMLLFSGCGTALKQRWTNFRSYYNTYFNASQSYERGYKIQKDQNRELNPEQPVRIHPPAVRAGSSEFQNSIEKSADLLRRFPDSKWTDDSIFLIGRSYFFQQELFSALEKFSELYLIADDPVLKQQAVYWKGRTFLELKSYRQGVDFINTELQKDELEWKRGILAEAQAVLAELYVQLEEYESAIQALEPALGKLMRNDENAFAYFLYGQLLERFNRPAEALQAYKRVPKYNPKYNVIYQARRKEAEIARDQGDFKESLKLFTKMSRDDKNFDIVTDLEYEIARTYLAMGDYNEAERRYYDLLYESIQNVSNLTKAKAYNDLGVTFQEGYQDLFTAQAYYDSSAALRPDVNLMPEDYKAPELAENLGTYVQLKLEIMDSDSLMRLGRMSEQELDSVLTVIKERKRKELEEAERQRRRQQNTMVNLNAGSQPNQSQNNTGNSAGFLSYRNPQLLQDNASRFRAIWGNRPLVPNWRRIEAVRNQQITNQATQDSSATASPSSQSNLTEFDIDLSAIPFTEDAQQEMMQGVILRKYQLGNLFYLQLEQPDSALYYFQEVINYEDSLDVQPQAMYAVVELLLNQGDRDAAYFNLNRLNAEYPNSIYTKSAAELMDDVEIIQRFEQNAINQTDQIAVEFSELEKQLNSQMNYAALDEPTFLQNVDRWINFSLRNATSIYASLAYEKGMKPMIRWATQDTAYQRQLEILVNKQDSADQAQNSFRLLKDSLRTVITDTTLSLSEDSLARYKAIIDSSLATFDPTPFFPYNGYKWNAVRERLALRDSLENLIPSKQWWDNLSSEIQPPDKLVQQEEVLPISADTTTFYDCTTAEWQAEPVIEPKAFYEDSVRIPRSMQSLKYFGDIQYQIQSDTAGKVISVDLLSEPTGTGIEMVLEQAIRQKFRIQPVIFERRKLQITCTYTFPVVLGEQD